MSNGKFENMKVKDYAVAIAKAKALLKYAHTHKATYCFPKLTFRELVEKNGDKILHWSAATDPKKQYVRPFAYNNRYGGTIDSLRYYNDYVVEISNLSGTDEYDKYIEFIKRTLKTHITSKLDCTELISEHNKKKVNRLLDKNITKFFCRLMICDT